MLDGPAIDIPKPPELPKPPTKPVGGADGSLPSPTIAEGGAAVTATAATTPAAEASPSAQPEAPKVEAAVSTSPDATLTTVRTPEQAAKDGGSTSPVEDAAKPAEGAKDADKGEEPETTGADGMQHNAEAARLIQEINAKSLNNYGREILTIAAGKDALFKSMEEVRARAIRDSNFEQLAFGYDVPIRYLDAEIQSLDQQIKIGKERGDDAGALKAENKRRQLVSTMDELQAEKDASAAKDVADKATEMAKAFGVGEVEAKKNPIAHLIEMILGAAQDNNNEGTRMGLIERVKETNPEFAKTMQDYFEKLDLSKYRAEFFKKAKDGGLLALLAALFVAWTASKTVGGGGQGGGHG